jgi:hypothetical protein
MTEIAERPTTAAVPPQANVPVAQSITQGTAIEQARAVAEVAAAVQVAQQNPRDVSRAIENMRQSCRQPALAERAFYSLPRAGGRVEGETVHLARELARCWGNVDHGIRELRRDDEGGESEMQAWAWDQEQNVRASRSFIVPHARMAKDKSTGQKRREPLMDLGDIANNNNSVAARAVRETIFQILPPWFKVEAAQIAASTLQDGGGKTREQQIADAIAHYSDTWNVAVKQLEERLQRPKNSWTVQDIALLRVISGELSRGEKRVDDEFGPEPVTAAEIVGNGKAAKKTAPAAKPEPTKAEAPDSDACPGCGEAGVTHGPTECPALAESGEQGALV